MRVLIVILAGLLLSACASTQMISPTVQRIDQPSIGEVVSVELGETIVEKGRLSTYEGLILSNELQWGDGLLLKRFILSPGRLKARMKDDRFTYYFSDNMASKDAIKGTSPYHDGGLCQANDGSGPIKGFVVPGRCALNWGMEPQVRATQIHDLNAPVHRQELIYNGRVGDSLKLLYREFTGDTMRPPLSQDLQYDLNESAIIGFRSVRIEVVEASNTRLTYRLLASFPDP